MSEEKRTFQVLEHNSSEALNALLNNPSIMSRFEIPGSYENKFNILEDPKNNGLYIMQAHNKFLEYLRNRMRLALKQKL